MHRFLASFALFAWLHLALGLYPMPSQRGTEIRNMAREAVRTQDLLPSDGIGTSGWIPPNDEQGWVDELTASQWYIWVESAALLLIGVATAIAAWRNAPYWKGAVLIASGLVLYVAWAPVVADMVNAPGIGHWLSVWWTVVTNAATKGELLDPTGRAVYWIFVWPMYHVLIVVVVCALWISAAKQRRSSDDKHG